MQQGQTYRLVELLLVDSNVVLGIDEVAVTLPTIYIHLLYTVEVMS